MTSTFETDTDTDIVQKIHGPAMDYNNDITLSCYIIKRNLLFNTDLDKISLIEDIKNNLLFKKYFNKYVENNIASNLNELDVIEILLLYSGRDRDQTCLYDYICACFEKNDLDNEFRIFLDFKNSLDMLFYIICM